MHRRSGNEKTEGEQAAPVAIQHLVQTFQFCSPLAKRFTFVQLFTFLHSRVAKRTHRLGEIPATRGAARRAAEEEERAWDSLLFSPFSAARTSARRAHLIKWCSSI